MYSPLPSLLFCIPPFPLSGASSLAVLWPPLDVGHMLTWSASRPRLWPWHVGGKTRPRLFLKPWSYHVCCRLGCQLRDASDGLASTER